MVRRRSNNRMAIIDYIFYRLYMNYKNRKGGEDPRFYTSVYFIVTWSVFFFPVAILIEWILKSKGTAPNIWILICFVIILIVIKRYNKRKIAFLIKRYKNSPYNNLIPSWIFFLILPLSLIWAFYCMILSGSFHNIPDLESHTPLIVT